MEPQACFALVAFDQTEYYTITAEHAPYVKQILNTYVYDQSEYTYLCEMTPSHYLEPVQTLIVLANDVPECVRDDIESRYAYENTEATYRYVRGVKAYVVKHPDRAHVLGAADSLDDAREYYQSNCPL